MAKIKITEQQARLLGLKPNVKVKITKEQYNRIFASGLIKENNMVKGGLNRVDKAFKQEFGGKLKEGSDNLKKETADLIKYMYRKEENFSPFWEQHGLTYEDICDALIAKKMVVAENGKCVVSKSLGDPQTAIKMIEDTLREMVGGDNLNELDNYPAGAEFDPRAPWNQPDNDEYYEEPDQYYLDLANPNSYNNEIAILKNKNGELYAFYFYDLEKTDEELADYILRTVNLMIESGKLNLDAFGIEAWENGELLVKIDQGVKEDILRLYDKSKGVVDALSTISENVETPEERMARLKKAIADKRAESERLEAQRQARLDMQNAIDSARAEERRKMQQQMDADEPEEPKSPDTFFGTPWDQVEETTTAASSGAFVAPMGSVNKREMPVDTNDLDVPVVRETTTTQSAGNFQYDANALPGINRDGSFKTPKKTKAQTKTQYADGAFVDFNDCTKLNNKPAGAGCSQGAVDKVVKYKKSKGNINAPSLSEGKTNEKQ
jgi:hypothetical protein